MSGVGREVKLGVFGHPVGHSLSPVMHAANFCALGMDGASYLAFDVAPEALASELARRIEEGYLGVNCTVPHKRAVMELMTQLDASALRYGAVNTVKIAPDGTTTGYNTDGIGFLAPLKAAGFDWAGARVLLLGAGGAASAVARACLDAGCAELSIFNRTVEKAEALARSLDVQVLADLNGLDGARFDLLVNATTVGLKPEDASAIPSRLINAGQVVYDLIPVRRETATLCAARAAGARTIGGLGMLVAQGAAAFEIWTGRPASTSAMLAAVTAAT